MFFIGLTYINVLESVFLFLGNFLRKNSGITLLRQVMLFLHACGDVLEVGAGTRRNISYCRVGNEIVRQVTLMESSDKMLGEAKSINSCHYKLMDVVLHLRSMPFIGHYIEYARGYD